MIRYILGFLALFFVVTPALAQAPFASFDIASEAVLADPHDLTIGPDGRLYIANKFGNDIVIMDPDTLEIVGRAGDGQLAGIHDVSFGPDGLLYVAVTGAGAVAVFRLDGDALVFENGISGFPRTEGALAHSNGRLYVMASGTGQLVAVADAEIVATASGLFGAHDVAEAPDGTIWVADNQNRRLVQFDTELKQLKTLSGGQFGFVGPRYLDIHLDGRLVVADQDAHRVLLIDPISEEVLGVIGDGSPGIGPGKFDDPEGVAISGNSYFFADSDNNRIVKYVVLMN
jgi:DNA-binding beta-propeller fold protein YncE